MKSPLGASRIGIGRRGTSWRALAVGVLLGGVVSWPAASSAAEAPREDPYELEFVDLTAEVFVSTRPESVRRPVEGNSVVVLTSRGVVVFDAGGVPRSARQTVAEIRRRTGAQVRYLINSHGHLDHTGGNQVWESAFPAVEILAGSGTRDYMMGKFGDRFAYVGEIATDPSERRAAGERQIAELQARGDPASLAVAERLVRYYRHDILRESEAFRELEITPPTSTLLGHLELDGARPRVRISHLGYGKTPGDLVLDLPDEGIVATGDILTHPIPLGFSRSPVRWLATLRALAELDRERYVPGHGDVLEGTAYLRSVIALVEELLVDVETSIESGKSREQTIETVAFEESRAEFTGGDPELEYLFDRWFREPAVARAFDELVADAR